ncbi:MAG TPA: hypothetical protein VFN68_01495 [Acidimicrobiales bacterium]|nr:hypothetical protein [Acidimicrobiales bacterium]
MPSKSQPGSGRGGGPRAARRYRGSVASAAAAAVGLVSAAGVTVSPGAAAAAGLHTSARAAAVGVTASARVAAAAGGSAPAGEAYSLLTAAGRIVGYGGGFTSSVPAPVSPVVAVASTPDGHGAYAAESDGAVVALGDAVYHGSMAGTPLNKPIVGIAADPAGGYWLVASDGGIFSFGGARFYGSAGSIHLAQPIVGMSATPDGHGYRMVAADGGIFDYGDATFYGSTGGTRLNRPVVGMATTPDGGGYWLVASDGGIFTFGDAGFYGSTGGTRLNRPVIAMAPTADGHGYWLLAADGGVFAFGDAPFLGSAANLGVPVLGMAIGSADNYDDPLRAVTGLRPERVDEGVDYGGSGPIYALGDGVVTSIAGSWPDGTYISYTLTDGPAAGRSVYVAENVTPSVTVGQTVTANTVLGVLHDAYPDMEIGWSADRYGDTMAAAAGQWTSADDAASRPSAYGVNFNQLLVSLGAPSGVLVQPTVTGSLAAGWPTW